MQTTLALILLAVLAGQSAAAAQLGARSSRKLLQENRIGDGAGAVLDAAGAGVVGGDVAAVSDADDGDLTNDLANTGQQVGQLMLDTLPAAGNQVPGRRRLLQPGGGGGQGGGNGGGAAGIVTGDENDVVGDTNQDIGETNQLADDTTGSFGVKNPANIPGVNNPGGGNVGGGNGGGNIAGAATNDLTADGQQTGDEGKQLAGDTVTNVQPAENPTGRK